MSSQDIRAEHVRIVREGFAAALAGDFDAISGVLAEDVRWYGAGGDPSEGCTSRDQALVWIGETVARGIRAEILDVRALDDDRVLVLLQRNTRRDGDPAGEAPSPHGQIVTFRGDRVSEIVVYPSQDAALDAAESF
ncbi:MAG: nuclear transport factor 2 family protein [Solirubrobacterales bacterium]|nr:nuclear transport factor 2 family protein [Solirubrobacterales bacterium]